MSVELYNQHTAISELQQVEDEMIDQLKLMAEFSSKFLPELMDLCRMTNHPDYDQDGEIAQITILLRNAINFNIFSVLQARKGTLQTALDLR